MGNKRKARVNRHATSDEEGRGKRKRKDDVGKQRCGSDGSEPDETGKKNNERVKDVRKVTQNEVDNFLDASTTDFSEEDEETQLDNCFGVVKVQPHKTYYRSNLVTVVKELKLLNFSRKHIQEIHQTPFWLLFNALYESQYDDIKYTWCKFEEDIRSLLKTFDKRQNEFVLGGEKIKIKNNDMRLIMGLASGSRKIPSRMNDFKHPSWVKRCFGQELKRGDGSYILTKKIIYEKLEKVVRLRDVESFKDVARLTHMYLLSTVLAPRKNSTVPWHYAVNLEVLEEIRLYDWCSLAVDMIVEQIHASTDSAIGGCAQGRMHIGARGGKCPT